MGSSRGESPAEADPTGGEGQGRSERPGKPVRGQKPVVNGTRIAVDLVIELLGRGYTTAQVLEQYERRAARARADGAAERYEIFWKAS
jgi:hypothetical protein